MIPEFVGRLPVVTALDQLTEDELVMILTDTKNAMIKQFTKLLSMEGVSLNVTKDALRALAAQAATKGTGARALRSMLERIMLDIMYDVPSRDDIADVTINRAVVEGKKPPLIRTQAGQGRGVAAESADFSREVVQPRRGEARANAGAEGMAARARHTIEFGQFIR